MKLLIIVSTILIMRNVFSSSLFISNDNEEYQISETNIVLNKTLDHIEQTGMKDIIVFIHGRGKHPGKGINYIPDMEKVYNSKIIMFSWESWVNNISRPELNAIKAAKGFNRFMQNLSTYKVKNQERLKNVKINFLAHSMGNIVFEHYIKLYNSVTDKNFFNSLILNAPDTDFKDHNLWVEKISLSKQVYITVNASDLILLGSKVIDVKDFHILRGTRLGHRSILKFPKQLAKNAHYLDFTKLTIGGHSHFRPTWQYRNKLPIQIVNQIFENGVLPINMFHHRTHDNITIFRKTKLLY